MSGLITVVAFIVTLGTLITIHEFGHYWVARRCGVKVLRFSIGFGRPLLRAVRGPDKTEWVIAALPLGGYVRMLDERDTDIGPIDPKDLPRAFNRQSVGKRMAIVVAGPLANLLLAVAVYWGMGVVGTQEPKAVLTQPPVGSVAERAGVREGDVVVAVDGEQVRSWEDMSWNLLQHVVERGQVELTVERAGGAQQQLSLDMSGLQKSDLEGNPLLKLGLGLYAGAPIIGTVSKDSPAAAAGLREGDRVLEIDGKRVTSADALIRTVRASENKTLQFLIERDGQQQGLSVKPSAISDDKGNKAVRIGAALTDKPETVLARYGVVESVQRALLRTWDTITLSLRIFWKMLTGEASLKNLSGPLTIADYAGKTIQISLPVYLSFLALVSISLGILNLLPIPVLDGGHLLYYLIEFFKGSPPADWIVEWGQRAGVAMLMALTALALYNDFARLLT